MGWTVKTSNGGGGEFEKAPPGNHPAVLVAIVDMGTQTIDGFGGAPPKDQHRAYMVWELVCEQAAGGRNHVVGIDLTLSLNEKAKFRKWIEARVGRPLGDGVNYDITQELGQPCLLNVIATEKGYPKIEGLSAVPRGMTVPPPQNKPVALLLGEIMGGAVPPDWLPYLFGRPIMEHVRESKEWKAAGLPTGDQPIPGTTPAPAGPGKPPPPGGPPRPPGRPAAERKFWIAIPDADPQLVPESRIRDLVEKDGLSVETLATPEGKEDWKPIREHVPAANGYIPF